MLKAEGMNRRTFFGLLVGLTGVPFLWRRKASTFKGTWRFTLEELQNPEFKGQFQAAFKYYIRPMHYEYARVYFHKRRAEPYLEIMDQSGWVGKRWNNEKGDWEAI